MVRGLLGLVGCLALLAGCAMPPMAPTSTMSPPRTPAFVLSSDPDDGAEPVAVEAYTYCLPGVCADAAPPEQLATVGSPPAVLVRFNHSGWQLEATQREPGSGCRESYPARVTAVDDTTWRLQPTGTAGPYDLDLAATGPGVGSAFAAFRWVTPATGVAPPTTSTTAPSCR